MPAFSTPRIESRTTVSTEGPIWRRSPRSRSGAEQRRRSSLEIKDNDKIDLLFETQLDPKRIPADRAGHRMRVDLSRYAGREVELLFSTDPGPRGDTSGDWAGWANLRFTPKDDSRAPPFKKIYDGEVLVFEVPNVMPRAAMFRAIEIVPLTMMFIWRGQGSGFKTPTKGIVSRESSCGRERFTPARTKPIARQSRRHKSRTMNPARSREADQRGAGPAGPQ